MDHTERKNKAFKIIENTDLRSGYYRLAIEAPEIAAVARPGQFCMLSVPGVFLRRPLSIYSAHGNVLEFLYKIVGKGTANLSVMTPGADIAVMGPLGTGYDLGAAEGKIPLLVGGGTGIASINFLDEKLQEGAFVFYGARTSADMPELGKYKLKMSRKDASPKAHRYTTCTEDGSCGGGRGFVTDELEKYIAGSGRHPDEFVIYSCGPHPMQKKVAEIALARGIRGFVSLEAMMACGVGNCQGCAVRIAGEHRMVCKDGPVFRMEDVEW